jgi:hypothetical protein
MSSPLWQSGQAPTDDTITLSSVGGTAYTGPFTINTSNVTGIANPWATNATLKSPRIQLNGPDADIEVNGESLMATLSIIKERLNYLQVNPELEAEWNELRVLGDQYRKLEQHIKDKQATWDKLKAMPKVDLE